MAAMSSTDVVDARLVAFTYTILVVRALVKVLVLSNIFKNAIA